MKKQVQILEKEESKGKNAGEGKMRGEKDERAEKEKQAGTREKRRETGAKSGFCKRTLTFFTYPSNI